MRELIKVDFEGNEYDEPIVNAQENFMSYSKLRLNLLIGLSITRKI